MKYKDLENVEVEACQLNAPTLLNTANGEVIGEAGQYVVSLPNSMPVLLSAQVFESSFVLVE